jgi:hypothetical protein
MTRRFRVAIATAGRFHVLDLAREFNALGYGVDFYSYVREIACRRFRPSFRLPSIVDALRRAGSGNGAVRARAVGRVCRNCGTAPQCPFGR